MSVVSGIVNANASKKASKTQAKAQEESARIAADTQLEMFYKGLAITAPWRTAGKNALQALVAKVKAGPGDYTESPGYRFRVAEGEKAIERSTAAKGRTLSGATMKALSKYNQDYATNDYQNFLANYYNTLTPLQSMAGVGLTAAGQNANAATQTGQGVGNVLYNAGVGIGNALATGQINQANSYTGAINSGMNNAMMMKYLYGNNSGTSGSNDAYVNMTYDEMNQPQYSDELVVK